jgi:hypothetical protein
LNESGLNAVNVGASTPAYVLLGAARKHRARLVWVSITSRSKPRESLKYLRELAGAMPELGATLVAGGQGLPWEFTEAHPRVLIGRNMHELVAHARAAIASVGLVNKAKPITES